MSGVGEPFEAGVPRIVAAAILGPAAMALMIVLWIAADRLVVIGPLERAEISWAALPLGLVSPFLSAYAWPLTGRRRLGRVMVAGTAVGLGLVTGIAVLAAWTPGAQIGCYPTASRWDFAVPAASLGGVAAIGYALAGSASLRSLSGGRRWMAVAASAAVGGLAALALLFTFVTVFETGVSCAWVPQ